MKKITFKALVLIAFLCVSVPSYAIDFIKFGTSHDGDFWNTPNNIFPHFPSTVQYLAARGKNETTSIDLTDENVQNVFNGDFGAFEAIVVSEQIDKISPESYALFNQFVSGGGCLILTGDHGEGEDAFLNNTFGYNVSIVTTTDKVDTFDIKPSASGTQFAGGPSNLTAADLTVTFGNTPGSVIYQGQLGVVAFTDNFGQGTVNVIGWDYCCLDNDKPPFSNTPTEILAWYEVANRAFNQCFPGLAKSTIPTLNEWGLIAMAGILGIVGVLAVRRRRAAA